MRLISLLSLALVACTAKSDDSGTTDTSTDADADTDTDADTDADAVSFTSDVWPLVESKCSYCHTDDTYHPGFTLGSAADAYTAFTTDAPTNPAGGYTNYVVAGDPAASLLISKIEDAMPAYGGAQMPIDGTTYQPVPMSADEQLVFRNWVAQGAANN